MSETQPIPTEELVNELLNAVKLAYRKHHLEDDRVGWEELSDVLLDAICNAIGAEGYLEWVAQVRQP